jgi:transcriptional regulator with XRE-family HTH domain
MASRGEAFSGNRLRLCRLRAGLLQRELAERCTTLGVTVTQPLISHWESARSGPLPPTLKVLAEALGVTVDDLLDRAQVAS